MSDGDRYLSKQGFEDAQKKLEELRSKQVAVSEEIARARGFGDISENAEYDAAKEKQALLEERIAKLQKKINRAEVYDDEEEGSVDKVLLGTTVTLEDCSDGEEIKYKLVPDMESDPDKGYISVASPVATSLIGHKKGETVEISVPVGVLTYKIIDITR